MCVYVYVYIYIYIRTYTCAYTRVSMPAEKLYTSKDALAVKERESAAIGRIQADRVGAGTLVFVSASVRFMESGLSWLWASRV